MDKTRSVMVPTVQSSDMLERTIEDLLPRHDTPFVESLGVGAEDERRIADNGIAKSLSVGKAHVRQRHSECLDLQRTKEFCWRFGIGRVWWQEEIATV